LDGIADIDEPHAGGSLLDRLQILVGDSRPIDAQALDALEHILEHPVALRHAGEDRYIGMGGPGAGLFQPGGQ